MSTKLVRKMYIQYFFLILFKLLHMFIIYILYQWPLNAKNGYFVKYIGSFKISFVLYSLYKGHLCRLIVICHPDFIFSCFESKQT